MPPKTKPAPKPAPAAPKPTQAVRSGREMAADFEQDAQIFENCFGLDVRFLHHHNHNHECTGSCVKNLKKKVKNRWLNC